MFEFKLTFKNKEGFLLTFDKLALGLKDFRFIWPAIAAHFYEIEKQTFASQGRSSKWAPLSARYGRWKAAKYPGKPILQREGALIASLTQKGAAGGFYETEPLAMRIGSTVPYAVAHQRGGGFLPARPSIDLTQSDMAAFGRILQQGFVSIAKTAGFQSAGIG